MESVLKYVYFLDLYFLNIYTIPMLLSLVGLMVGIKHARDRYMELSGRIVIMMVGLLFTIFSGYGIYFSSHQEISLSKYERVDKFKSNLTIQHKMNYMMQDEKITELEYLTIQDKLLELENEVSLQENNITILKWKDKSKKEIKEKLKENVNAAKFN